MFTCQHLWIFMGTHGLPCAFVDFINIPDYSSTLCLLFTMQWHLGILLNDIRRWGLRLSILYIDVITDMALSGLRLQLFGKSEHVWGRPLVVQPLVPNCDCIAVIEACLQKHAVKLVLRPSFRLCLIELLLGNLGFRSCVLLGNKYRTSSFHKQPQLS